MYRLVLSVIFILCSTSIGFWFSAKLTTRRKSLELILRAISETATLVDFTGYEITRVIKEAFGKIMGFVDIDAYLSEGLSFNESFEKCVCLLPSESAFLAEDKQLLLDFSKSLGVTDLPGQIANCELYYKLFEERIIDAKEKEKACSRLYKILGFSLGCVVTLMIV